MTRLTKAIKTDIKDLIRDKAINPKELALEAKKREFLLKVFWGQTSKHEYQAWKMLPKGMYENMTYTTYSLWLVDESLGRLMASYTKTITYPRNMGTYMTYENLPKNLQQEFKELIKEVDEILHLYSSGEITNQSELARMYGLSQSSIRRLIQLGLILRH